MKKKRDKENQPYTANYPPLQEWLNKIGARCARQLPVGDSERPQAYIEQWLVNGHVFIVVTRVHRREIQRQTEWRWASPHLKSVHYQVWASAVLACVELQVQHSARTLWQIGSP